MQNLIKYQLMQFLKFKVMQSSHANQNKILKVISRASVHKQIYYIPITNIKINLKYLNMKTSEKLL